MGDTGFERARRAVRDEVQPLLDELARYTYSSRPEPKRRPDTSHMDDHAKVVRIRAAASGLSWWRRRLADRRCKLVFGDHWTGLAINFPSNDSLQAWLVASLKREPIEGGRGPAGGLMHRAYCQLPGDPLQAKLKRHLKRLSASR